MYILALFIFMCYLFVQALGLLYAILPYLCDIKEHFTVEAPVVQQVYSTGSSSRALVRCQFFATVVNSITWRMFIRSISDNASFKMFLKRAAGNESFGFFFY